MKPSRFLFVCFTITLTVVCSSNAFLLARAIDALSSGTSYEASEASSMSDNSTDTGLAAEESGGGSTDESAIVEEADEWTSDDEYAEGSVEDDGWAEEYDSGGEEQNEWDDEWDSSSDSGYEDETACEDEWTGEVPEGEEQEDESADEIVSDAFVHSLTDDLPSYAAAPADETTDEPDGSESSPSVQGSDEDGQDPAGAGSADSDEAAQTDGSELSDVLKEDASDVADVQDEPDAPLPADERPEAEYTVLPEDIGHADDSTVKDIAPGAKDPDNAGSVRLLYESVTHSGGFLPSADHFEILAAAGEEQVVTFTFQKATEYSGLFFTVCAEGDGARDTEVCIAGRTGGEESSLYHSSSCTTPQPIRVDVRQVSTFTIHVSNHSGHEARLVFYDLGVSQE